VEEQKIRLIKDLAPKPSDAIKAMLEGLRTLPGCDFEVDMATFGDTTWKWQKDRQVEICCGCAATCAVHQLAHKKPDPSHMGYRTRANYLGLYYGDMRNFEAAIDDFRRGNASQLFWYYDLGSVDVSAEFWYSQPWCLNNNNWPDQLPLIEEYRQKLVVAGF
jgi:hypothetical protein